MNPGQVSIDPEIIKRALLIKCECGGAMFQERMMLKRISPIVSPTGKEELFPMNVLVCTECGLVPSTLNPGNMVPQEYLAKKMEPKTNVHNNKQPKN